MHDYKNISIKPLVPQQDIELACNDFLERHGMCFFSFGRIFDDGSCYFITTNEAIFLHIFAQQYRLIAPVPHHLLRKKLYYLIPETGPYQQVVYDARHYFNRAHFINIYECHQGFIDVHSFGAHPHNEEIKNFYFNHIDLLENFSLQLKEKIIDVRAPRAQKIILPEIMRLNFTSQNILHAQSLQDEIKFTKRQKEVLSLICRGKTAKQIGLALNLSHRTVEHYIDVIKAKTNTPSKSQLIEKFIDSK